MKRHRRTAAKSESEVFRTVLDLERKAFPVVEDLANEIELLHENLQDVIRRERTIGDGVDLMLLQDEPSLKDMYEAIKSAAAKMQSLRNIKLEINKLNRELLALEGVNPDDDPMIGYHEWPPVEGSRKRIAQKIWSVVMGGEWEDDRGELQADEMLRDFEKVCLANGGTNPSQAGGSDSENVSYVFTSETSARRVFKEAKGIASDYPEVNGVIILNNWSENDSVEEEVESFRF